MHYQGFTVLKRTMSCVTIGGPTGPRKCDSEQSPICSPCNVSWKGGLAMGRGWVQGGAQAPYCSSLPVRPPMGEVRTLEVGKGGGAAGGKGSKGKGGWQQLKGKLTRIQEVQDGGHTVATSNYWGPLQARRPQAVRPRGQGFWGVDKDALVPIRNSLVPRRGRNLAPDSQVSQCAPKGGCTFFC